MRGIKQKALEVIEAMTCNDDFAEDKLLSTIYMFSHIAVNRCKNKHEDWLELLDKAYIFYGRENEKV